MKKDSDKLSLSRANQSHHLSEVFPQEHQEEWHNFSGKTKVSLSKLPPPVHY
jgi:hypothetical protein